jgi:hypothetical protein
MNDDEQQRYEELLRRAQPARPSEEFMARLRNSRPAPEPPRPRTFVGGLNWSRWLAPVAAAAFVGLLIARARFVHPGTVTGHATPLAVYGLKVDDLRVDEELVSSFDVVAQLPDGVPVRFRCQKWQDQWVASDTNHGVQIEENNPRVEVTPLRFETY